MRKVFETGVHEFNQIINGLTGNQQNSLCAMIRTPNISFTKANFRQMLGVNEPGSLFLKRVFVHLGPDAVIRLREFLDDAAMMCAFVDEFRAIEDRLGAHATRLRCPSH